MAVLSESLCLLVQAGGAPNKVCWPGERDIVYHQSLGCSASLSSTVSISSSSLMLLLTGSTRPPNIDGVSRWARTFSASMRLHTTAGDPSDIGLPEHELCPDLPWLQLRPGGAVCVTGDPGVRFRSSFSWSVMGDILGCVA